MTQPQQPNVGTAGAPAQPSSGTPTTSRPAPPDPTAIEAFRRAQSANDRLTHLSGQMGTVTRLVENLVTSQQASNDEQFYSRLGEQLAAGEIEQSAYTRRVAERAAQAAARQAIAPPQPQQQPNAPQQQQASPDPATELRRAQQIGSRAIVQGLGLQGNEQGLDFSSPQALVQSGQRILAERQTTAPQQPSTGGPTNVQDQLGELGRQQGYVIPHRDGGRPVSGQQPVTSQDLDRITWDKRLTHSPLRMKAALQAARDAISGQVPTVHTGEGLLGNPGTFRTG